MHQTKKGNQWHFGMKAHIGVDAGVVHTVTGTAANQADITQMAAVPHGREEAVFGDAGYTGADKRAEHADREVSWNIAIKRSIIKALRNALRDLAEPVERALSQVRAWVEHPFHVVKNLFRHKKLRYVNAGEKMHRRAGVKMHHGRMGEGGLRIARLITSAPK
jgi:transposase, IS5 family